MELASNLFSKGLLMDTNPMVQGNETLTDCLNGTLITMNGNEVILLNDMGNRRVNDAFLPSGYEPVGMKEYGGIIYIAAYNPITNKSQIGSFPSPLKKIDSEVTNSGIEFDFKSFFPSDLNEREGKFLSLDSYLIPLTKENMHAGDKFSIWANKLSDLKYEITNYGNTEGNKAYSPKNRKYTIKVGILNSLNLFVDITKTLSRWEEGTTKWELKKYILGVSDVYKFNDGYFIPDEFNNEGLFEGIEDAKLIKHRQKLATNTYSYKLIGPLYLNIKLNHIENFNYDILGTYDEKNKEAKLKITSYIIYNCPDGVICDEEKSLGNQDYVTFEEGLPTFSGFDLRRKDETGDKEDEDKKNRKYTTSTYDVNTNTYLTKITKYYKKVKPTSEESDIFEYFLGVLADSEVENVYLKGISEWNSIDLSLLGSGIVKIYGWKFYNNIYEGEEESESNLILNIYLNAYPEPGTLFKNLRFKFKEITSSNGTTITYGKSIYYPYLNNTFNEEEIPKFDGINLNNGKTTININYQSIGLEKNKLYEVKIYYDIIDEFSGKVLESKELGNEENVKRWILTTTLFNSFFNNPVIKDFSIEDSEEFKAKMDFSLYVDDNITSNISDEKLEVKGSLISENKNIRYYLEHKNLINIKVDPKMKIANPELYPDILQVNSSVASGIDLGFSTNSNSSRPIFDNGRIKVLINGKETSNDVNDDFISELSVNKGDDEHNITLNQYSNDDPMFSYVCNIVSNKLLNISCVNLDAFAGYSESPTSNINLFSDVSDMALDLPIYSNLESEFEVNLDTGYYGGIVFNSEEKGSGHRDLHQLFVYRNLTTPYFNTCSEMPPSGELYDEIIFTKGKEEVDYKIIGDKSQNKKVTFKFSDYEYDIYKMFNKSSKQVFKFCTLPNYSSGRRTTKSLGPYSYVTVYEHDAEYYGYIKHNKDTYNINDSSQYYKAGHLARVWWKAQNGWIMFDDFFDLDTGLSLYFGDSHDTSLSNENIQIKFKNFLDQNFNKKYIYCRYKNITGSTYKYYIAKNNFIYNNPYSISVKFSPIYKKLSGNDVSLCSTVKFGNLEFNNLLKDLTNFKSNGFTEIILRSNENFLNRITSFMRLLIEGKAINLYKGTGLNTDINGEYLKENKIYYIEDGQIYPTDTENDVFVPLDITSDSESTTNKLYALTFSKIEDCKLENYPVSRYDFLRAQSNADGNILLDYKGVHTPSLLIVRDPVFNYGNFGGNRATSSTSQTITNDSSGHFGR